MRLLIVIASLLGGWMFTSQASSLDHTFRPQVTIFKAAPSDTIEIKAKQVNFVTTYNSETQAFYPIDIPFSVHSVKGGKLNYRIVLQVSDHFCVNNGSNQSVNNEVSTLLDNKPFYLVSSGSEGSDGYVIKNTEEQSHILSVRFKENSRPQLSKDQACYGLLGVTAGVEV